MKKAKIFFIILISIAVALVAVATILLAPLVGKLMQPLIEVANAYVLQISLAIAAVLSVALSLVRLPFWLKSFIFLLMVSLFSLTNDTSISDMASNLSWQLITVAFFVIAFPLFVIRKIKNNGVKSLRPIVIWLSVFSLAAFIFYRELPSTKEKAELAKIEAIEKNFSSLPVAVSYKSTAEVSIDKRTAAHKLVYESRKSKDKLVIKEQAAAVFNGKETPYRFSGVISVSKKDNLCTIVTDRTDDYYSGCRRTDNEPFVISTNKGDIYVPANAEFRFGVNWNHVSIKFVTSFPEQT